MVEGGGVGGVNVLWVAASLPPSFMHCTRLGTKLTLPLALATQREININEPMVIQGPEGTGSVRVTALDANHCPGSCMCVPFPFPRPPRLLSSSCLFDSDIRRSILPLFHTILPSSAWNAPTGTSSKAPLQLSKDATPPSSSQAISEPKLG